MSKSLPVAVITGGAKGIGAACAETLARSGFNIALSYVRSQVEADHVVNQCLEYGNDAVCIQSDVAIDRDCLEMADFVFARWGRIDVLVNNAGVTRFADSSDLDTLNAQDFEDIFAVNVTGAYQMTRAASRHLKASPIASVVSISSHSGFSGIGSSMAYAASKGALNTLTLALARALAPNIRVNAICPGFVDTDWMKPRMNESKLKQFKQRAADIAPLKRLVTAREVAEAVSWLVLGGKSITGQTIVIDGGTHLTVGDPV